MWWVSFEKWKVSRLSVHNKKKIDNYYIHIPIEQQIIYHLEKNLENILSYVNFIESNENFMCDIQSAKIYKSINSNQYLKDDFILPLTVCTDGAQMYRSTTNKFYPIFVKLDFLPPNIRFKPGNTIIVGLYYGKKQPDIAKLLFLLSEEIKELTKKKILVLYNELLLRFTKERNIWMESLQTYDLCTVERETTKKSIFVANWTSTVQLRT